MITPGDRLAVAFKAHMRKQYPIRWSQALAAIACVLITASLGAGAAMLVDDTPTREVSEILRQSDPTREPHKIVREGGRPASLDAIPTPQTR